MTREAICWHCGHVIWGKAWYVDSRLGIQKPVCQDCIEEGIATYDVSELVEQLERRLNGRKG